jgi:hypothetical protein
MRGEITYHCLGRGCSPRILLVSFQCLQTFNDGSDLMFIPLNSQYMGLQRPLAFIYLRLVLNKLLLEL